MSTTIKTLRRDIERAKGVPEGSVVLFTRTLPERRDEMAMTIRPALRLSYAAIFVGGKWHFTGAGGLGRSQMTHARFLDLMAEPEISEVRLVTETAEVI